MHNILNVLIGNHRNGDGIVDYGTIELKNRVMISDPCYEVGTWCQGITSVKGGKYHAYGLRTDEGDWGTRIAELVIVKEDEDILDFDQLLDFDIGVDSGQAGFFDYDYYEENVKDDDWDNKKSWYRRVCDLTLNINDGGVIDGLGVVSCSGLGDGGYECYGAFDNDNNLIGLRIVFIGDYDEEEEWED